MQRIENISAEPYQQQTLILDTGEPVILTLNFKPNQTGWFITELLYRNFVLQGMRVVNSPNLLNQFRNLVPFGLGCFSDANREPFFQEDFATSVSRLYILSEVETAEYAEFLRSSG